MAFMDVLSGSLRTARKNNHRRLFVLMGSLEASLRLVRKAACIKGLRNRLFVTEGRGKERGFETIRNFDSLKFMGTTQDLLVIDMHGEVDPRTIGRLTDAVRGGGLILFLIPARKKFESMVTKLHNKIVTPPYTAKDIKHRFNRRLLSRLDAHEGVYVYDVDGKKFLKKSREKIIQPPVRGRIKTMGLDSVCATDDQLKALRVMEKLSGKTGVAAVLTSDRGRGKSAVIGIGLVSLASRNRKKLRAVITSPYFENVQETYAFAQKALRSIGIKSTINGYVLDSKILRLNYLQPLDVPGRRADIHVIDEAAGIHLPLVWNIMREARQAILSTTVHGYEGTGRIFNLRFLPGLRKKFNTSECALTSPIRYAENDPVEGCIFDALLLDAEPCAITRDDLSEVSSKSLYLQSMNLDKWFDSDELRDYFGIYVYAHYRNSPTDLLVLGDAPNHGAYALRTKRGNKIVAALQVAEEGTLPVETVERLEKGEEIRGNLVPDLMVKYYHFREFANVLGGRVVRIAVHPDLFRKGLGNLALEMLERVSSDKAWTGAGFGAEPGLLSFWIANGYTPVHISPKRNRISGEYNMVVVKPRYPEISEVCLTANRETKLRLVSELKSYYKFLDPEVVFQIFESGRKVEYAPALGTYALIRLHNYLAGFFHFEASSDAIEELIKYYFLTLKGQNLGKEERCLLIRSVLQRHQWSYLADESGITVDELFKRLRQMVKKLYDACSESLSSSS